MSCTVVAIPWALVHIYTALTATAAVAGTAAAIKGRIDAVNDARENIAELNDLRNQGQFGSNNEFTNDIQSFAMKYIIEKEFETPFTDKEILLKTLEEHGVEKIEEYADGTIVGVVDSFTLNFVKNPETGAYTARISCNKNDNAEEKVNDLNSEYALNVQEAAYLSIIEKLKENNMQIEDETVDDDNTITLTINLE